MCGRYTLHQNSKALANRYNIAKLPANIRENYNVAPGQIMPVVVEESGQPSLELMKWGLIPVWAKDPNIGYKLINARAETIFEKPMWRSVIKSKRCLIPADGFYEWKKLSEGAKAKRRPYYIHPKQTDLFSFAGVWETWKDVDGLEWRTYSIITTEPNKEMAKVHDRMPVILRPEDESSWLDSSNNDKQSFLADLLVPLGDDKLDIYQVGDEVNSPRNNNSHLIQAVA